MKFLMTLRVNKSSWSLQAYTTARYLIRLLSASLEHAGRLKSTHTVLSGIIVKMLQCCLQRQDRGGEAGMEWEHGRYLVLKLHDYSQSTRHHSRTHCSGGAVSLLLRQLVFPLVFGSTAWPPPLQMKALVPRYRRVSLYASSTTAVLPSAANTAGRVPGHTGRIYSPKPGPGSSLLYCRTDVFSLLFGGLTAER